MNTVLTILGVAGLFLLGFFAGLWCSREANEKETRNHIKASMFTYNDKAYKIEEIR